MNSNRQNKVFYVHADSDDVETIDARAIGVVHPPQTERISHYFNARLAHQFDAVMHFDQTRAVEPLEHTAHWERGELPETFSSGV